MEKASDSVAAVGFHDGAVVGCCDLGDFVAEVAVEGAGFALGEGGLEAFEGAGDEFLAWRGGERASEASRVRKRVVTKYIPPTYTSSLRSRSPSASTFPTIKVSFKSP